MSLAAASTSTFAALRLHLHQVSLFIWLFSRSFCTFHFVSGLHSAGWHGVDMLLSLIDFFVAIHLDSIDFFSFSLYFVPMVFMGML